MTKKPFAVSWRMSTWSKKRSLRSALAGTLLLGGALTASLLGGALPASAAAVIQTIGLNTTPLGISSDGTHVWVANIETNSVTELDASTGLVVQTILVGQGPEDVSSDGTHVWVANTFGNTVDELDASDGSIVQANIPVGQHPTAISSDGTHVWVMNQSSGTVSELDASTGSVLRASVYGVSDHGGRGISSDGTHVWVTGAGIFVNANLLELDASQPTTILNPITLGSEPTGVSSDGTHVWVTDPLDNSVTELNASTGSKVQTIAVGDDPEGVSSDGSHVWVANNLDNTVSELDASTGSVLQTIAVGNGPGSISSDGTHVWVANDDNTVSNIAVGFSVAIPSLPSATRGTAYGPVALQAANIGTSSSPYTTTLKWHKVWLPTGLKLSSAGVLSGTPSTKLFPYVYPVGVKVTETVFTLSGGKKVKTQTTVQAVIPLVIH